MTRACEICGKDISHRHPLTKTCGPKHSQALARKRVQASNARRNNAGAHPHGPVEADDIARDVIREELRTFINRDVLTEDVLAEVKKLVAHAPAAIQLLVTQLDSEDEVIAQRAATAILKYTLGNPSVAPEPQSKQPAALQVVFGMPDRNVTAGEGDSGYIEGEAVEERICSDCHQSKPGSEFVGKSDRCEVCFNRMQSDVAALYAPKDESRPT